MAERSSLSSVICSTSNFRMPSSKTSTRLRPRSLARYMAASASRRSSSAVISPAWHTAIPMLSVAWIVAPLSTYGVANDARTRSATAMASLTPARLLHSTTNSSPPNRETVSFTRTAVSMRSPTCLIKRSPTSCPSESFTILKRSTSMNMTPTRGDSPASFGLAPSAVRSRCTSIARLARPVSSSCSACFASSQVA